MQHEGSVTKAERNALEAAEHRGIETGISLALFADTPFGTPSYTVEGWRWSGPDGSGGVCSSEAEAIKAAKADYKSRCRRM